MLFKCGGPGCPSAQVIKLAPGMFTARLRQRFDIVGFDPRATGESTPVRCGLPAFDVSIARYPDTQAGYSRLVAFNRALARSCEQLTGAYLMHIGAVDVMRDMEAIRDALRDGKRRRCFAGARRQHRLLRRCRGVDERGQALQGPRARCPSRPVSRRAEDRGTR